MKKVITISYFEKNNQIVNESIFNRIANELRTPAYRDKEEREARERELSREIQKMHKINYGLDDIYEDNDNKKDYPDLSKQYLPITWKK